jgi:hypothetical protein
MYLLIQSLPPAGAWPTNTSQLSDSKACNFVVFGLLESGSILELKPDIDEYLTGKSVNINDVFRLGKYSSSSKHPWPILIKLATAQDHPTPTA